MKVAIMQPYFFPYIGYFKLFAQADLFVIYDCVQFPRRGWVHRNRLICDSKMEWVTLPIKKCPQTTKIFELEFQDNKDQWFDSLEAKLDSLVRTNNLLAQIDRSILAPSGGVLDYLENTLKWSCNALGLSTEIIRSSTLCIDPNLKAQARIIELCLKVGASEYINLPNGTNLYNKRDFDLANISLEFLPVFDGNFESLLGRLFKEPIEILKSELL
jgi:hypothetical protein